MSNFNNVAKSRSVNLTSAKATSKSFDEKTKDCRRNEATNKAQRYKSETRSHQNVMLTTSSASADGERELLRENWKRQRGKTYGRNGILNCKNRNNSKYNAAAKSHSDSSSESDLEISKRRFRTIVPLPLSGDEESNHLPMVASALRSAEHNLGVARDGPTGDGGHNKKCFLALDLTIFGKERGFSLPETPVNDAARVIQAYPLWGSSKKRIPRKTAGAEPTKSESETKKTESPIKEVRKLEVVKRKPPPIRVIADDKEFEIERLKLVTHSLAFRKALHPSDQEPVAVTLSGISKSEFAVVRDWMNGKKRTLTEKNANDIMLVAERLGMAELYKECQILLNLPITEMLWEEVEDEAESDEDAEWQRKCRKHGSTVIWSIDPGCEVHYKMLEAKKDEYEKKMKEEKEKEEEEKRKQREEEKSRPRHKTFLPEKRKEKEGKICRVLGEKEQPPLPQKKDQESEDECDCITIISGKVSVYVDRAMAMQYSRRLRKLFECGDEEIRPTSVSIAEVSEPVLRELAGWLNRAKICLTPKNVAPMLELAEKLEIPLLRHKCRRYQLDVDEGFRKPIEIGHDEISRKCPYVSEMKNVEIDQKNVECETRKIPDVSLSLPALKNDDCDDGDYDDDEEEEEEEEDEEEELAKLERCFGGNYHEQVYGDRCLAGDVSSSYDSFKSSNTVYKNCNELGNGRSESENKVTYNKNKRKSKKNEQIIKREEKQRRFAYKLNGDPKTQTRRQRTRSREKPTKVQSCESKRKPILNSPSVQSTTTQSSTTQSSETASSGAAAATSDTQTSPYSKVPIFDTVAQFLGWKKSPPSGSLCDRKSCKKAKQRLIDVTRSLLKQDYVVLGESFCGGNEMSDLLNLTEHGIVKFPFDAKQHHWVVDDPEPSCHAFCAAVIFKGKLYVSGGRMVNLHPQQSEAVSGIWRFDRSLCKWTHVGCMLNARIHHSAVVFSNSIFFLGGLDKNLKMLSSVEQMVVKKDRVESLEISSMSLPRAGLAAAATDQRVFVAGGLSKQPIGYKGFHILDLVEFYDPNKVRWYRLSPLTVPRAFATMISCNNVLYIVGGITSTNKIEPTVEAIRSLSQVETYSGTLSKKDEQQSLNVARYAANAVIKSGTIYVFGGIELSTGGSISVVERFSHSTGAWIIAKDKFGMQLI